MDGWEFLAEQRGIPSLAGIPVVVLTAAGHLRSREGAPQVVERLRKPVDVDVLLEAVAKACARNQFS
jgi:CheY-like chemotaxis protein